MKKRIICLSAILAMFVTQISIAAGQEQGQQTGLDMEVLFECDFENSSETTAGRLVMSNSSVGTENGRNVLKANSAGGTSQFYVYADKEPENCEATLVSFDMCFEKNTTRGYMDIFQPAEDGGDPSFDINDLCRAMYIVQDGRLSYFESFMPPSGTRVVNSLMYSLNRWYHYDTVELVKHFFCLFADFC